MHSSTQSEGFVEETSLGCGSLLARMARGCQVGGSERSVTVREVGLIFALHQLNTERHCWLFVPDQPNTHRRH